MGTLPAAAIALFRTPPDRFVAERDALVKELREAGHDDDAAAVKALRKPTATVWALNQLADRTPDDLAALFDAGRALRAAQSEAIAGDTSGALVDAGSARRASVGRLTTATVAILDEGGHRGAAQADAIGQALEAASIDADIGAELSAGTLEKLPTAASVAAFGVKAMHRGDVVAVPGFSNKLLATSIRFSPRPVVRRLVHKMQEAK